MQKIERFISRFTENKLLHIIKIGKNYYHVLPELRKLMEKAGKNIGREAQYVGIFLGKEKEKNFIPSLALLDMIGRTTHRWVMVDDKAEWLFLCGRDIFSSSVVKANVKKGMVMICNKKKEILGYGDMAGTTNKKDNVHIKNILDKGDFLRREIRKKTG